MYAYIYTHIRTYRLSQESDLFDLFQIRQKEKSG